MNINLIRKKINEGYNINDIKLNVTFYARVSTDHDDQINSLENQKTYFYNLIKNNINWHYIDGYIDEGITGMSDIKRINFIKMIEDAKKGLFDLIITKEISRFSRNTLDSIKYTRILEEYGVGIYFINDNINTFMKDSELRLTIMSSLAQDEIRRLSERVKFGMNEAIKKGHILGNNTLYGYDKISKNNLKIVEDEAIIIKKIYYMYAIYNVSLNKIVKTLNASNIKTKYNKDWTVTTITKMLKNPKYKGYYCAKKSEVDNFISKKIKINNQEDWLIYKDYINIPPIIDEKIWDIANKKLNRFKTNNKDKYLNRYPLSSVIYCKFDKHPYHRRIQLKNNKDVTWICSNNLKNGKKTCDSANIRESELKIIINNIIDSLSIDLNYIKTYLLNIYKNNCKNNQDKKVINDYKKEIEKIKIKKEKILEHNINGIISNEEFKGKNDFYNLNIAKYENLIIKLTNNKMDITSDLEREIDIFLKSETIYNRLIKYIINKIEAYKLTDDMINLDIYLNIKLNKVLKNLYDFKRGYESMCTKRYVIYYQVNYFEI